MSVNLDTASVMPGVGLRGLRFLWLEITGKCNLECGHCYAESGPHLPLHGQMRPEDWLEIIREARALGCRSCQFIGGEPTLHPNFREFVAYARGLGTAVEVYTNATRLTADLIGFLAAQEVRIATSFYSESEEDHDRVTARKGSWARTVDGIERVVAAGLPLRVGVIETRHNIGQWTQTKRYLEGLGVDGIGFDRERRIGRSEDAANADPMGQLCGQCSKGRLCVTSEGRAYPCVFSRFVELGDPRTGLATILASPSLGAFQMELDGRFEANGDRKASDCTPSVLPCKPDQCEPAGCNPAFCTPNENCGPMDDCGPHNPCNPNLADAPDKICSPHELCSPGKS